MEERSRYPLTFSVAYPERDLSRLSTFFRIFAAIPIAIVLSLLTSGADYQESSSRLRDDAATGFDRVNSTYTSFGLGFTSTLFLPILLMLLFRKKYPGWWAYWNRELLRFANRVCVYVLLMDDRYPSTDEQQAVQLDFPLPDGERLSRGLPLIKWLLALPHYIVLVFLWIAAAFCVFIAWFAILFTARYPRGLFHFVEGVLRWQNRVAAYAFILVTDDYPPFSLDP